MYFLAIYPNENVHLLLVSLYKHLAILHRNMYTCKYSTIFSQSNHQVFFNHNLIFVCFMIISVFGVD